MSENRGTHFSNSDLVQMYSMYKHYNLENTDKRRVVYTEYTDI